MRPDVPKGVRLLDPPDGADPQNYWRRVRQIRTSGVPWYISCLLIRQEALGLREVGVLSPVR